MLYINHFLKTCLLFLISLFINSGSNHNISPKDDEKLIPTCRDLAHVFTIIYSDQTINLKCFIQPVSTVSDRVRLTKGVRGIYNFFLQCTVVFLYSFHYRCRSLSFLLFLLRSVHAEHESNY